MKNVRGTDIKFWDEGNWNLYPWFRKGFWKRHGRKKFLRRCLKETSLS